MRENVNIIYKVFLNDEKQKNGASGLKQGKLVLESITAIWAIYSLFLQADDADIALSEYKTMNPVPF